MVADLSSWVFFFFLMVRDKQLIQLHMVKSNISKAVHRKYPGPSFNSLGDPLLPIRQPEHPMGFMATGTQSTERDSHCFGT